VSRNPWLLAARVIEQQRHCSCAVSRCAPQAGGKAWRISRCSRSTTGLLLEVHALAEPAASGSPLSATLRGFAHEVKNPLAGLRGAAQLLQRRVATRICRRWLG
jgi:two-component system nitrogen regulation sensor histidine kinase GlnL